MYGGGRRVKASSSAVAIGMGGKCETSGGGVVRALGIDERDVSAAEARLPVVFIEAVENVDEVRSRGKKGAEMVAFDRVDDTEARRRI
jgi:hypothetical protein